MDLATAIQNGTYQPKIQLPQTSWKSRCQLVLGSHFPPHLLGPKLDSPPIDDAWYLEPAADRKLNHPFVKPKHSCRAVPRSSQSSSRPHSARRPPSALKHVPEESSSIACKLPSSSLARDDWPGTPSKKFRSKTLMEQTPPKTERPTSSAMSQAASDLRGIRIRPHSSSYEAWGVSSAGEASGSKRPTTDPGVLRSNSNSALHSPSNSCEMEFKKLFAESKQASKRQPDPADRTVATTEKTCPAVNEDRAWISSTLCTRVKAEESADDWLWPKSEATWSKEEAIYNFVQAQELTASERRLCRDLQHVLHVRKGLSTNKAAEKAHDLIKALKHMQVARSTTCIGRLAEEGSLSEEELLRLQSAFRHQGKSLPMRDMDLNLSVLVKDLYFM